MKIKEILEFVEKLKIPIGFGNYEIKAKRVNSLDGDYARIEIQEYMRDITIELPPDFFKLPLKTQKNVLIHELIHCRVLLSQVRTEKIAEKEEELMVNDITTLVEEVMNYEM